MPILLILLLACQAKTNDSAETAGEGPPPQPDVATGGCGAPVWEWAPMARMGDLVAVEEMEDLSMSAASLDAILALSGVSAFSPLPYGVNAHRVRYITQDRGQEVEATAFVALPDDLAGTVPMVMFAHGTTGFMDDCAPSAGGLEELAIPMLLAALGMAVVAPDYLGLNGFGDAAGFLHPYLVPEATAVACLDSLRALRALHAELNTDVVLDPAQTVVWGGSEGGFAALWSERYAPYYAPEFKVVADIALVPPTDALDLATHGAKVPGPTTLGVAGALVAMNEWYGASGDLTQVFTDEDPTFVASNLPGEMAASCSDYPSVDGAQAVLDIFVPDFAAAMAAEAWSTLEPWACYLSTATLHTSAIPIAAPVPTLVVLSEDDDLVISAVVRSDLGLLCKQGQPIQHLECAGADHAEGALLSLPYQVDWLQERLAGVPIPPEDLCVLTDPVDCEAFLVR